SLALAAVQLGPPPHLGPLRRRPPNVFQFLPGPPLPASFVAQPRPRPTAPPSTNSALVPRAPSPPDAAPRPPAYPRPTSRLAGAGDRGVLDHVRDMWWLSAADDTPYDGSGTLYDAVTEPVYRPQAGAEERHEQR
ncbi:uncharacterized protein VDAG_01993, partial [Verticillium dahliae VdLs.17]